MKTEKPSIAETAFHEELQRHLPPGAELPRVLTPVLNICRSVENPSDLCDILVNIKGIDENELVRALISTSVRLLMKSSVSVAAVSSAIAETSVAPVDEKVGRPHDGDVRGTGVIRIFEAPVKKVSARIEELADGRAMLLPGASVSMKEQKTLYPNVRDMRRKLLPANDGTQTHWVTQEPILFENVKAAANFCLGGILSGMRQIPVEEKKAAPVEASPAGDLRLVQGETDAVSLVSPVDENMKNVEKSLREAALRHVLPFGGYDGANIWRTSEGQVLAYSVTRENPNRSARFSIPFEKLKQVIKAYGNRKKAGIVMVHYKRMGYVYVSVEDLEILLGYPAHEILDVLQQENRRDLVLCLRDGPETDKDHVKICVGTNTDGMRTPFRILVEKV